MKTEPHLESRYLVMNPYELSMYNWVIDRRRKSTSYVIKIQLHMIFRAVATCHYKGVVHRDIKLDNILIGNDLIPKLIDFGMSWMTDQPLPNNICGTGSYMAPEIFKKNHVNTFENMKRIDSWALGVLVYFTAYDKNPFICYPTPEKLWETIST